MAGALLATVALTVVASLRLHQAAPTAQVRQATSAPSTLSGPPTAAERARAQAYGRQSRALALGTIAYQAVLLLGFLFAGGTRWLARLVQRFGGRWALAVGTVGLLIAAAQVVLFFPLDFYGGYVMQHQYGLSNQTVGAWLRDYGVGAGVQLVLTLPLLVLFYGLVRRAPRSWWLWVGAASLPLLLFVMLIQPVFIAPLFNRFTPLADADLRERILALAHAHGVEAQDIYQVDASRQSTTLNAYVNGVGPTQRVVLYDTLLTTCTPEEIQFVMAHEIGHYVLGHIPLGIAAGVLGTFVLAGLVYWLGTGAVRRYGTALGIDTLTHPAGYPLLLALTFGLSLLAMPIGAALSRQMERQADLFAVQAYPHPEAGISVYYQFVRHDLSEENPPRWAHLLWGSHPTLAERIALLQRQP